MPSSDPAPLTRRDVLRGSLGVAATLLAGCGGEEPLAEATASWLAGGERIAVLPWPDDDLPVFGRRLDAGWDGRRFVDLSRLTPERLITARDQFFLRTFEPSSLAKARAAEAGNAVLRVEGLVAGPGEIPLASLPGQEMGAVLIECAGNDASAGFGLMSCARWQGVPIAQVLAQHTPREQAFAIEVRGADDHAEPSRGGHSSPGAAWIFRRGELEAAGAFLATGINGQPLHPDGGAPLRLVVPGWYGCTHVKWVEALRFVAEDEAASAQMREFARRTHQRGVPERARDYQPARVDAAALPVRVEQWRVAGETLLRVVGVAWGERAQSELRIRITPGGGWTRVERPENPAMRQGWTLWEHAWRPQRSGNYTIACRYEVGVRQRRQASGFHERSIRL